QTQLLRDLAELAGADELEVTVAPAVRARLDAADAVHRQVVLEQGRAGRGEVRRCRAAGDRHAPFQDRGGRGVGPHDARRPAPQDYLLDRVLGGVGRRADARTGRAAVDGVGAPLGDGG